jgi:hypothetical protein
MEGPQSVRLHIGIRCQYIEIPKHSTVMYSLVRVVGTCCVLALLILFVSFAGGVHYVIYRPNYFSERAIGIIHTKS